MTSTLCIRSIWHASTLVLAVVLSACSGGGGGDVPSEAGTQAASAPTDSGPLTLRTDPSAELTPGDYASTTPALLFAIPVSEEDKRWYGASGSNGWGIRYADDPCDGCESGSLVVLAVDGTVDQAIEEWQALEGADLSEPKPTLLGHTEAIEFEGSVPSALDVAIVHGGYNPHGLVHVYMIDIGGQTVAVVLNQYSEDEEFFSPAREVVDTFQFG